MFLFNNTQHLIADENLVNLIKVLETEDHN